MVEDTGRKTRRFGKILESENIGFFLIFMLISCILHLRVFTEAIVIVPRSDALYLNYPLKLFYSNALKNFEFPLWSPYEFAGIPFSGIIHSGAFYPPNIVFYFLLEARHAYNLSYILHYGLLGFFSFMYLRLLGLRRLPAFSGSMIYGFVGFLLLNQDHTAIANATVYFPLIMYLFERLRRTPEVKYSLLISLAVAFQALAGNFQISLYTYMVAGFYLLFFSFGKDGAGWKFSLLGALGISVGLIIALPQIAATSEFSSLSFMRMKKEFMGYEYFSRYHIYLTTLPSLIFPRFFENWGPEDNISALTIAPVFILAVIAFAKERKNRHVLFWAITGAVALILALGKDTPLNRALYTVPVYNQFRIAWRHTLEFLFAVSALFAVGMEQVLYSDRQKAKGYMKALVISTSAVIATTIAAVYLFPLAAEPVVEHLKSKGFVNPAYIKEALSLKNPALYAPVLVMSVFSIWCIVYTKFRLRALKYAFIALLLFEILHGGGFKRYMFGEGDFPLTGGPDNLCLKEAYGGQVSKDTDKYFRIANVFPPAEIGSSLHNPSANITCRLGSVNSYEPLALDEYSRLLDLGLTGVYSLSWQHMLKNNIILSMLGAKYITVSKAMDIAPEEIGLGGETHKPVISDITPRHWTEGDGSKEEAGVFMLKSDGKTPAEIFTSISLEEGAYVFSLSAKAGKKQNQFLAVYLFEPPRYAKHEALFVHPDYIETEEKTFTQVTHIKGESKPYIMRVVTGSLSPLYVRDISIKRIDGYMPQGLNDKEQAGIAYEKLSETPETAVYLNRNCLPKAWSVSELTPAKDFLEAKKKLDTLEINPVKEAMLYENDLMRIGRSRFPSGRVAVEKYGINEIILNAEFPDKGFIVLSEQHYPGWKAFVDGKRTEIFKVNGILRGVVVPEGTHSVAFKYRPYRVFFLLGLSGLLASGILICLIIKRPNGRV